MATTAEVLSTAAQVIENYWPEQIDVVTAIRIAAGPDDDGPEAAERALCALAAHLDYGQLNVWSDRQPTVHILAELRKAASAAETDGS
jgi:hypothetical protein